MPFLILGAPKAVSVFLTRHTIAMVTYCVAEILFTVVVQLFDHREHTILLSGERVNKGTKRMNSLRCR